MVFLQRDAGVFAKRCRCSGNTLGEVYDILGGDCETLGALGNVLGELCKTLGGYCKEMLVLLQLDRRKKDFRGRKIKLDAGETERQMREKIF